MQQQEMELVTIESLVPAEHWRRKIDATVDLEFIRARVRHRYCRDNGRPALDPVGLFKLLLIGYLFGIRSERQLMRAVQCNAAYRWFLRLKLTDRVLDASTLSQSRRRRFRDSDVYQQIFDEIVELACRRGLVTGQVLYTDSTHLKANANRNKFDVARVEVQPVEYLAQLEAAIDEDRAERGKRELKARAAQPATKAIKVSRTARRITPKGCSANGSSSTTKKMISTSAPAGRRECIARPIGKAIGSITRRRRSVGSARCGRSVRGVATAPRS